MNKKRILVVDDDSVNRKVMKLTLTRLNYLNVIFAESGILAEKLILSEMFDLILMDCHMPFQNGFTTTENIRKLGFSKSIIAVTAYNTDLKTCKLSGMNDLIYKPYNKELLLEKLKLWLK